MDGTKISYHYDPKITHFHGFVHRKIDDPPPIKFRKRCNVDCVMCALSVAHFDVQTFS